MIQENVEINVTIGNEIGNEERWEGVTVNEI